MYVWSIMHGNHFENLPSPRKVNRHNTPLSEGPLDGKVGLPEIEKA